jgi:choline dehydrogenase-like flavoprotein
MKAATQLGMTPNPDINSGNSMGIGFFPQTTDNFRRVTSASATLAAHEQHLAVRSDSTVTKILVDGLKASGVRLSDGRKSEAPLAPRE